MDQNSNNPESQTPQAPPGSPLVIKIFGIGNAGLSVLDQLTGGGLPAGVCVALNSDPQSLAACSAAEKIQLETGLLRGLGSGGDPERGRAVAEEHSARLKSLCDGAGAVFIVAGFGGGVGTGASPVLARVARECGALVLGFVLTPFVCEGNHRQRLAQQGLSELREVADGVICLPNQTVFKLIDENTSVLDTFKLTNSLLADAARGFWRLFRHSGLLDIPFGRLCDLLRDAHTQSAFAVAEAAGPTRSREVMDRLSQHPMLEGGAVLSEADAVLVSVVGGSDLTMTEVNRLMEEINAKCPRAQVMLGAAIDEAFQERLAVTLIAARRSEEAGAAQVAPRSGAEGFDTQLLRDAEGARPGSRFVPPAPALPPDQMAQLLARQGKGSARGRRSAPKLRQTQLPLEIVSKGRFDKSEPTIHKGEDLDVPAYIRRGVALN